MVIEVRKIGVKVEIPDEVMSNMARYEQLPAENEKGGILLGMYDKDNQYYQITDFTVPTEHDNSGPSHFVRNKDVAQKEINRQWMESDGLVNYLGEWHTHAQVNPKPSIVDLSLLRQIIKNHSSLWPHLLMLILGQAGSAILIVVEQKRKRRMQFKVEVNFSNAGVCNR